MKNHKKWIRLISIAIGIAALTFLAQKNDMTQIPDKTQENYIYVSQQKTQKNYIYVPKQKNDSSSDIISPKYTATIQGEITEIYACCLIFESTKDNLPYICSIPEDEKSKEFKIGDIITVCYNGMILETSPAQFERVISIEIE